VVIIGNVKRELSDEDKKRSFELYRRQLADVMIGTLMSFMNGLVDLFKFLTVDWMHRKANKLVQTTTHSAD